MIKLKPRFIRTANQRMRDGSIENLIVDMLEFAYYEEYENAELCKNKIYNLRLSRFLDKSYPNEEISNRVIQERKILVYYSKFL
jgi:hypothetical protein